MQYIRDQKVRTDSTLYEPYLKLANDRIPSTEMNKNFTYLGKDFDMHISNDHIKSQFVSTIKQYLTNYRPTAPSSSTKD